MQDSSIIDLHCHSTASDGTYAPKEVAALAQKIGLSAIALTDHDTIDGLAEFQATGNALGIEAIAGIEFAALWEHFHRPEIHIVGLGFDPAHPVLKGRMETIRSSRDIRNRRMCERLSSIGLHLTLDEVAANAGGEIISRFRAEEFDIIVIPRIGDGGTVCFFCDFNGFFDDALVSFMVTVKVADFLQKES